MATPAREEAAVAADSTTKVLRVRFDHDTGALDGAQLSSLIARHVRPALVELDELVAFPTETVYGLGANALSQLACSKIYRCKGRPSDNPLIVHVSDYEMLRRVVAPEHFPQPGSLERQLCERFWPGPLTFLFPKSEYALTHSRTHALTRLTLLSWSCSLVAPVVTANRPRVAVRMPSHPVALAIIKESGYAMTLR